MIMISNYRSSSSISRRIINIIMQAAVTAASNSSFFTKTFFHTNINNNKPTMSSSSSSPSSVSHTDNSNSNNGGGADVGSSTWVRGNEEVFRQKKAFRSKVRKELKAMPTSLRQQQDNAIQNLVLEASWFKSCTSLCAYISCEALHEVDTSKILSEVLSSAHSESPMPVRRKLYVPRVEDKNSHMRMLCLSSIEDLIANSMNILEPAPIDINGNQREDVMQANQPVDLFLLPGLAFDRSGRRLGRGGGYYDCLLTKYLELVKKNNWQRPLLVALAYSLQMLDDFSVPATPADVLVDAIVSPDGVLPISPVAEERM